jgi:rubredoxin
MMRCPSCGYEWKPRVPNPKECPRCKTRMDYVPGVVGAPSLKVERREVRKAMAQRLPWVAAAVIIVVAVGLAAWALMPAPAVKPVVEGPWQQWWRAILGVPVGTTSTEGWSGSISAPVVPPEMCARVVAPSWSLNSYGPAWLY